MQVLNNAPSSAQRMESLDWLRGLLAISIMLYHLYSWNISSLTSESILGRLGIYGVSIFFVLSGLSMAIVYNGKISSKNDCLAFFIRRAFRIMPMLWLAIASAYTINIFQNLELISGYKLFLNITGFFGFIDPSAYINTGAWSIGNEIVYYSITPAILMIYDKSIKAGNSALALSVITGLIFALFFITGDQKISEQWDIYINPLNNLFLFISGISIYYNSKNIHSYTASIISISISSLIFAIYPAHGDQSSLVQGMARVFFGAASVLIVYGFYKYRKEIGKSISYPLELFGSATYGIYLLHPLAHSATLFMSHRLGISINPYFSIIITSAISVASAVIAFKLVETPMIRVGRSFSKKILYNYRKMS